MQIFLSYFLLLVAPFLDVRDVYNISKQHINQHIVKLERTFENKQAEYISKI